MPEQQEFNDRIRFSNGFLAMSTDKAGEGGQASPWSSCRRNRFGSDFCPRTKVGPPPWLRSYLRPYLQNDRNTFSGSSSAATAYSSKSKLASDRFAWIQCTSVGIVRNSRPNS